MDDDIASGSTSGTLDDDWVKDAELSRDSGSGSPASLVGKETARGRVWMRLLGVANRPNPLLDWDQLYNLSSQSVLRNDCRALAKAIGNVKSVPELESLLTLYCKKRHCDYNKDAGWMSILEKIISCQLPNDALFNVFHAFTIKYVPKDASRTSELYSLFRLLLQYHDPQLASHLDSIKATPFTYSHAWFSTLFAAVADEQACLALWDIYIEKGDPFLVLFMALVLVVNARDELLAKTRQDTESAVALISRLPAALTIDDVADFVDVASYYSDRTPACLREELHGQLFDPNLVDEHPPPALASRIALPVSPHELCRKPGEPSGGLAYFVIDCRSQAAFSAGNIYGSFNLESRLFVDAPDSFAMAMSSLEAFKSEQKSDDHICFVGYGDEDRDQYLHMVVSRFLRDNKHFVSVADGGYKAIHRALLDSDRLRLLNRHDKEGCEECGGGPRQERTTSWNLVGRMRDAVISKSAAVKGKVSYLVSSPSTDSHVSEKDRHGKRYRNEPSVFSLDDSGSEDDDHETHSVAHANEGEMKLSSLLAQPDVLESFECEELVGLQLIPSHIALTRTHMHVLRVVDQKKGTVSTQARHSLASVVRVTSKKKVPELLTFKFGYEKKPGESEITAVHKFLIPKAGECAKAVKTAIFTLRPLPDE